jgi:glycosyltransferase involved in cell wall biosynthesis
MPVKVLVISNYHNIFTVRPEAEIFIDLAKRGFEVEIMTYGDSPYIPRFKEAGIKVIDFHPKKKLDKEEIHFIREHLTKGKHDIVHLFSGRGILNGIQAAKRLPVKIVLYRGYAGNIHWYDPTAYLKFLHPRVDKILCNTKGVADAITKNIGFNKSKIQVINKGHYSSWYDDVTPTDRASLGFKADDFLIVNVANNRAMKDIPTLLKSADFLPKDLPIHILLVGRDMDDKANMAIIENSPNKDKIHLLGFRDDALSIVKTSDVFALTSIYGESITKSVIESMSMGTVPIITDIAGNKELVENGVSGFVIPTGSPKKLAERIQQLYEDKNLYQRLSQGAINHINTRLNHDRTVDEYEVFYTELANQS